MTPKISIIIPVYNTEKYLAKCLYTAINQTLKDIEIIVIDDASTDNSLKIIKNFQEKDLRIQLIAFTKNKGNGIGRNTALKKAKGDYILFLDSDDWLEKQTAELMYTKAISKNYEMVLIGYKQIIETTNEIIQMLPSYQEDAPNFYNYFLMNTKGFGLMPWCYLYSRELLKNNKITFTEGIYFEDINFVARAIFNTKKIGVINKTPLYNYLIHEKSITGQLTKKKIEDLYTAHVYLKEFLIEKNLFETFQKEYLICFLVYCVKFSFSGYFKMNKKERDTELDEFMKSIRKSDLLENNSISLIKEIAENYRSEENTYKHFKNAYQFLGAVKHYYTPYKYIFKIFTFFESVKELKTNINLGLWYI